MNKRLRNALGGFSAAGLVMAGSLPLMGGDPPATKKVGDGKKQSQTTDKSKEAKSASDKPSVKDNAGSKSCSCGKGHKARPGGSTAK